MPSESYVSLAELEAAGVRLRPVEAATIAREVFQQVMNDDLPGVPSAQVLRLGSDGRLTVEGPVETGGRTVPRAAQLLDALLPGFDAPPELRVPGALRLVAARALGTLDLPAYPSLRSFSGALARFAASDAGPVIASLAAAAAGAQTQRGAPGGALGKDARRSRTSDDATPVPAPLENALARLEPSTTALTVSDIRRARRATGLTLGDIATRSHIPAWLLRELEWGYYRNWPDGQYGRTQLIRYARAAGLDDQVVMRTVWPMVERDARTEGRAVVPAMEWTEDPVDADIIPAAPESKVIPLPPPAPAAAPRYRLLAALAIPALIAIGLMPAALHRMGSPDRHLELEQEQARVESPAVAPGRTAAVDRAAAVNEDVDAPRAPENARAQAPAESPEPPAPAPAEASASQRAAEQSDTRAAADTAPAPTTPTATAQRALDDTPAYSPAFSSVGTAMFYHTAADGQSALMRADADSHGAVLRVTSVVDDDASNYHPRPSPDGSQIAFDSDRDGERAVFIADADGQNVRRISGEGFAAIPSWSPDGRTLAYVRAEPDRPRVWNIWLTSLATGESRRLTSHRVGQPWGASWFPDGQTVAYSHETRLVVLDVDSGKEREFQTPVKGGLIRTPAVSPDGRRIMFQVHRDGAWLLNVADGSMRKVLSDPTAEEYTWAPDGRRVAYHSRQSGAWGVWVMASR